MQESIRNLISPENFGNSILNGSPEKVYLQCSEEFRNLVTVDQFNEIVNSFNEGVKKYNFYQSNLIGLDRHYIWLDNKKEKAISVIFDSNNIIQKLLLKPYLTFPNNDKRYSKNTYIMPIKEEWFVFWGGTNEFLNYHYAFESQRYAYDLVVMKEGKTYQESSSQNENYFAFKKEIVSPADGKVIKVVSDIADNIPGEMNELQPAGNYCIIEHSHQEFSLIAHFKQHSLMINEGDIVTRGQVIGLCGNSGNSSEPHIHFHVMNYLDYNNCQSLRIRFYDKKNPIQGDIVKGYIPGKNGKLDHFDKIEHTLNFADLFLLIPRIIGSIFKS